MLGIASLSEQDYLKIFKTISSEKSNLQECVLTVNTTVSCSTLDFKSSMTRKKDKKSKLKHI